MLIYCSSIWRPHLVKFIIKLEKIQQRTTKHILNDLALDCKSRLISLQLFPLMMTYEINDLVFFLKCLKSHTKSFNTTDLMTFSSTSIRSFSSTKLKHTCTNKNTFHHLFFNWLPRLWNLLPPLDCSLPLPVLSAHMKSFFWSHFLQYFDPSNPCTFHMVCSCSKCLNCKSAPNFVPLC